MQPGDHIQITARRADGTPYRWWEAVVEEVSSEYVVTRAAPGQWVHQPDGGWPGRFHVRTWFWPARDYNLSEVYHPDWTREELYVHIASPPEFIPGGLRYHDRELDVVKKPGAVPEVADEDEFAAAAQRYGYSAAFQAACRAAVAEALALVERWQWRGPAAACRGVCRGGCRRAGAGKQGGSGKQHPEMIPMPGMGVTVSGRASPRGTGRR